MGVSGRSWGREPPGSMDAMTTEQDCEMQNDMAQLSRGTGRGGSVLFVFCRVLAPRR